MYGDDRDHDTLPNATFHHQIVRLSCQISPNRHTPAQEHTGGVSRTVVSSVGAPPSPELSKWIAGEVERARA